MFDRLTAVAESRAFFASVSSTAASSTRAAPDPATVAIVAWATARRSAGCCRAERCNPGSPAAWLRADAVGESRSAGEDGPGRAVTCSTSALSTNRVLIVRRPEGGRRRASPNVVRTPNGASDRHAAVETVFVPAFGVAPARVPRGVKRLSRRLHSRAPNR